MSLAQEEADRLLSDKSPVRTHPEDQYDDADLSDNESTASFQDHHARPPPTYIHSDDEDDDEYYNDAIFSKPMSYHVPKTVYDANTGPKGVIADAQSYERARKRSFRRTLMNSAGMDGGHGHHASPLDMSLTQTPPDESEDERFMREWRAARMQELQMNGSNKRGGANGKRKYGAVEIVSANGYLDAVENAPMDAVVVVCIYDPESVESSIVEDCLMTISRKHVAVRFIKLHHEIADMEHVQAPALLAYKGGEVFATIVDILKQLPNGRNCSSASLEDMLMLHRVL